MSAENVTENLVEGGYGRIGMKWRSPEKREFSRLRRMNLSPRRRGRPSKCPEGSRKDTRKGPKRNASGCRRVDRSLSPRRPYTRKMVVEEVVVEPRRSARLRAKQ